MDPVRLKRRVLWELGGLSVLTVVFLVVFRSRPSWVNIVMALFALALLLANARFTRVEIWSRFPASGDASGRLRQAFLQAGAVTAIVLGATLGVGFALGYAEGSWSGAVRRVADWRILVTAAAYLPWALLQQTLFQFYLLGRLLVVLPFRGAIAFTGIAYSLVHLPRPGVTAATAVLGIVWTLLYFRYRRLLPLALSHAILGAAFYGWLYGHNLVDWLERVMR